MISQLIKCRLVCNSCKTEIEFERDLWSNDLPDGWEIWIEKPTYNSFNLNGAGFIDGYVIQGFTLKCDEDEFSNRRHEKHLCPNCKNIRDIIE